MIGGHIEKFCKTYFSMNSPGLAQYPDFFAVCLILLLSGESLCAFVCPDRLKTPPGGRFLFLGFFLGGEKHPASLSLVVPLPHRDTDQ